MARKATDGDAPHEPTAIQRDWLRTIGVLKESLRHVAGSCLTGDDVIECVYAAKQLLKLELQVAGITPPEDE